MKLKHCYQCEKDLPISDFYKNKSKGGLVSECKNCNIRRSKKYVEDNKEKVFANRKLYRETHHDEINARQKRWGLENSDKRKGSNLKRDYNLTWEQFQVLLASQNNLCASCGKSETKTFKGTLCFLSVDHDHSCCSGPQSCGKCIRGLLCSKCNTALGLLDDSLDTIQKLFNYAERTRRKSNGR